MISDLSWNFWLICYSTKPDEATLAHHHPLQSSDGALWRGLYKHNTNNSRYLKIPVPSSWHLVLHNLFHQNTSKLNNHQITRKKHHLAMLNPPVIPSFHLVQCQWRVRLHRSSVPTRTRSVRLGVVELLGYDARCAVLASRRRPCERQWEWHDDICYENPLVLLLGLSVGLCQFDCKQNFNYVHLQYQFNCNTLYTIYRLWYYHSSISRYYQSVRQHSS